MLFRPLLRLVRRCLLYRPFSLRAPLAGFRVVVYRESPGCGLLGTLAKLFCSQLRLHGAEPIFDPHGNYSDLSPDQRDKLFAGASGFIVVMHYFEWDEGWRQGERLALTKVSIYSAQNEWLAEYGGGSFNSQTRPGHIKQLVSLLESMATQVRLTYPLCQPAQELEAHLRA